MIKSINERIEAVHGHLKNKRGITLVALVVTIIILLILAGITISSLTGSGLFENAKLAEQKSNAEQEKEEGILTDYENKIVQYLENTRENNDINIKYITGTNNSSSGIEEFKIEHDNENAAIFTGQGGLYYSINSTDNFQQVSALGVTDSGMGFYLAYISVKKEDIIYIKRDTSWKWGYAIVY